MAKVTVVTLHVEGSDETVADGIRTISQTINQFVEQHRASSPMGGLPERPALPVARARRPKVLPGQSSAPAGKKKEGPAMVALRRLLVKPQTSTEAIARLKADGISRSQIHCALSNGKSRGVFRHSADGVWSLA